MSPYQTFKTVVPIVSYVSIERKGIITAGKIV
jgi:hypothetical protein